MYAPGKQEEEDRVLNNDMDELAEFSRMNDFVDFAGRMIWCDMTDKDGNQILDAAGNLVATVTDVQKAPNGQALHTVEVLAPLALNQEYTLAIDSNRRHRVMKNHTATHLLHAALHNILGHHATQAGSLNEVEFLRFDFTHFQAVTPEELACY